MQWHKQESKQVLHGKEPYKLSEKEWFCPFASLELFKESCIPWLNLSLFFSNDYHNWVDNDNYNMFNFASNHVRVA